MMVRFALGFNRTFMELKFERKRCPFSSGISFNRTFMELKSKKLFV